MSKFYKMKNLKYLRRYVFILPKEYKNLLEKTRDLVLENYELQATNFNLENEMLELKEKLHHNDRYIDGLHQDLQEAIDEIDRLRGDVNEWRRNNKKCKRNDI